jgi:hypothetical protein
MWTDGGEFIYVNVWLYLLLQMDPLEFIATEWVRMSLLCLIILYNLPNHSHG